MEFGISVEATLDYAVTASAGLGVSVGMEVSLIHAKEVVSRGLTVIGNEILGMIQSGGSLTLDSAVGVLEKVLHEMDEYGKDHEDALGEGSISVSMEGGLGAGIWDCTWNMLTVETGLELAIPASKLGSVAAETLAALLQSGKSLAKLINSYAAWNLDYTIPDFVPSETYQEMRSNQEELLRGVEAGLGNIANALVEAGISTEFCMYLSADALGGKDNGVNVISSEATIPVGGIAAGAVGYLASTIEGMSKILGELMSESMMSYENPPEWDGLADTADKLAEGTRFSFAVWMPPGFQLVLEASAKPLLYAAVAAGETLRSALVCMVNSVKSGSLAEFRTSGILENLINAANGLRDLTLGLRSTIGAYGEVGAEAYAGAGVGASLSLSSNMEMLLLFANASWDHDDYTGQANFSVNANISAEGGLSLGEGVEVKAGAEVWLSTNFLSVSAAEFDGESGPPLLYSADGSESSANMQSLKLTAKGYDGEVHTFTPNYVKDAKHPLKGYYEIWAPILRDGSNVVKLDAKAFISFAAVSITKYGSHSVTGTGEASDVYLLSAGTPQVNCDVSIASYDGKTVKYYPVVIKGAPNLQIKELQLSKGSPCLQCLPTLILRTTGSFWTVIPARLI